MNLESAMQLALKEAYAYEGATAPNPPVGAVALDEDGNLLASAGHPGAGQPHAEALVAQECIHQDIGDRVHTMVVTLEPCNHHGLTPPCSKMLKDLGIKRLVYGCVDPNPKATGGLKYLASAGVEIIESELSGRCATLLAPFKKLMETGKPYVTIKRALNSDSTMIPPEGQKTFTSPSSLDYAHELRKRSDAIITGSGTILADNPFFTVRRVPDHSNRKRELVYLDRRGRVSNDWVKRAGQNGFHVSSQNGIEDALKYLGQQGCLRVLIEAGPLLSNSILESGLWDEEILIHQGEPDNIEKNYS